MLNVTSLCSGVGLIDLGLEWAGMRTVQFCEIDPYAVRVLKQRFPGVPIHPDAWTIQPKECDVITAGFPCQPFSVAGKRRGDQDDRHLWPAIIRAIRLARPRYVILENVPGIVTWGLGEVLGDLAAAGFDAEWTVFGASDIGAPHRRHRWWLVASSDADRVRVWDESGGFFREGWGSAAVAWKHGATRPVADADGRGCHEGKRERRPNDSYRPGGDVQNGGWWAVEPDVGRVANGVPARMDRLRCLGNGVVPQCAELIGLRMMQLDGSGQKDDVKGSD